MTKLEIDGDVSSSGGDIASVIYKQGLDVNELISALKRAFPKNDPRPEQFRAVLEQLHQFHSSLNEWKELHNCLDVILSAFGQFDSLIQRADAEKDMPRIRSLRSRWRAVSVYIDSLEEFARHICYIGKPYSKLSEDEIIGEPWVIKISVLRRDIDIQLGVSASLDYEIYPTDNFIQRKGFRLGIKPNWWLNLLELTNEFNHIANAQMYLADKELRDAASELYTLSSSIFGREPYEKI